MKQRQYLIGFGWATLLASIFALYYVDVETKPTIIFCRNRHLVS